MRFSIQPEPRPEQNMRTVSIDDIVSACENDSGAKPPLEYYFSPTKKEAFTKNFLHYLNSGMLDAKHGNLDREQYLAFILSFQFTVPLLEISAEKELGLFYRILQKTYQVHEVDLNLHFSMEWQKEQSIPSLAEAFGRSIVIPSFFSFTDRKLLHFYRQNTEGITYRVAVPETIE